MTARAGAESTFIDHILAGGAARVWLDPASLRVLVYSEGVDRKEPSVGPLPRFRALPSAWVIALERLDTKQRGIAHA